MKDLKKFLRNLPTEKPGKVVDNVVARVIKREIERWQEKKASVFLLFLLFVLGFLGIKKLIKGLEILGTAEFWGLARQDFSWVDFQAIAEGNPLTEAFFIIFISLVLIVPIIVLVRKDRWLGR